MLFVYHLRSDLQLRCRVETNSGHEVMLPVWLVNVWDIIKVGDCSRHYNDSIYPSTITLFMTGDRWTIYDKGAGRFRYLPLPASKVLIFLWVTLYSGDQFTCQLLAMCRRSKLVRWQEMYKQHCFISFQKNPQWLKLLWMHFQQTNVFERATTLPGRFELSLAATTSCRRQLSSASTISDHYYKLNFRHGELL